MSIFTTPVFYYDYRVTVNNIYLNFNEGIGELTATIPARSYSFTDLASQIALSMNSVGSQEYAVTANRSDQTYTISAASSFDILFSTGSNEGLSIASVIGFNSADKTGLNIYTSDTTAGKSYTPQFPLQNFVGFEDFEEAAEANINQSASGAVEVYSIGVRRFMEFNIGPITDNQVRKGSLFIQNENAVSELRDFMRYATTKGDIEFMPDNNSLENFSSIILEKTPSSSNGVGYKLRELYSRGLIGFFETGLLTFRERT